MKGIYVFKGKGGEGKTTLADLIPSKEALVADDLSCDESSLDWIEDLIENDYRDYAILITDADTKALERRLKRFGLPVVVASFERAQERRWKRTIPIAYLAKAQALYVDLFEWEDLPGIPRDEYASYVASKRAYEDLLDKMFLDDKDAKRKLESEFNRGLVFQGTFKEICSLVRSMGYEVLSKDNSTKAEHDACKKACLEEWREWKRKRS